MTNDVRDSCIMSAAYWADYSNIVLANGDTFSFKDREYQLEVMQSKAKQICVKKGTGLGFSEIFILRTLHGCIFGKYKQGVLYLFPNADEMQKFSKTRFGPLIQANRDTIGRHVRSFGLRGTDTASVKRISNSNLYMDGATLTQVVGKDIQHKESAALTAKQVDLVVFDELDMMDETVEGKAEGRLGNSDIKEMVFIANPRIPGMGIDKKYNESDQRMWFRWCGCGEWTCPDEYFPDLIGIDKDGKGYCACKKCGKPLGYKGQWVAKKPDNKDIEGYTLSQLNSCKNDPWQILKTYNKILSEQGNIADFYKNILGLAYVSEEEKLRITDIYACCGQDMISTSSAGPCAAGVDIGKTKHVIIGQRIGKERFEILKVSRVLEMNDIHDLFRRFNVKSAVIDLRPEVDGMRQFQKSEISVRIYLCEYTENPLHDVVWNNNDKTVRAYRTGIFDATHRLIAQQKIELPRRCPEIDEFAVQLINSVKILETNKKTGTPVYRYINTGDDHYRNALNYFYLAASGSKIQIVDRYQRPKQLYATHETVKI